MFLNPPGSLWSASQSLTTRVCGPWYGSPEDIESHFMPPDGQSSWHEYRRSYDLYLASTCSNLFTVKIDLHDTCLSHLALSFWYCWDSIQSRTLVQTFMIFLASSFGSLLLKWIYLNISANYFPNFSSDLVCSFESYLGPPPPPVLDYCGRGGGQL